MSDKRYAPEDDAWIWLRSLACFLLSPLFIPFILIGLLVSIPADLIGSFLRAKRERMLKRDLSEAGRFLQNDDLKARLESGSGTLIVVLHTPKGPVREWWTNDDIINTAPSPLPARIDDCKSHELKAYAKSCVEKYTINNADTAMLTNGVYAIAESAIADAFPRAKVVSIFNWFPDGPLIAQGHYADQCRNAA